MSDAPTTPASPETVNAALIGCTDGLVKYPLRFEVRPLLVSAMEGSGPSSIFIMLAEGQSRTEAEISLWHEIVHVLMHAGGSPPPTTAAELTALEQQVEAIAQKLAAVCPEIIELCGVQTHFPNDKVSDWFCFLPTRESGWNSDSCQDNEGLPRFLNSGRTSRRENQGSDSRRRISTLEGDSDCEQRDGAGTAASRVRPMQRARSGGTTSE